MTIAEKMAAIRAADAAISGAVQALAHSTGPGDEVLADGDVFIDAANKDAIVYINIGGKIVRRKPIGIAGPPTQPTPAATSNAAMIPGQGAT
jgi:hypothetical protein